MRYNNSFFNENAIKHSAWNWWDTVLTGATGGLWAAGKGIAELAEKETKVADDRLDDDAVKEYIDKNYPNADEATREKMWKSFMLEYREEHTPGFKEDDLKTFCDFWKDQSQDFTKDYDYTKPAPHSPGYFTDENGEETYYEQALEEQAEQAAAAEEAAETAKQAKLAAGELAETEAQQNATTSAIQAQNAGLNKERAGMMGEANLANRSNANNALAGIAASTQADYLNKIGQANALQQQAENMQKGAALNTAGATVSGAAQGLSTGASLFGTSDENEKTSCSDLDFIKNYYSNKAEHQKKDMTSQILEQAQKMFELKAQLDKLKENK